MVHVQWHLVGKGMPDEFGMHVVLRIERGFKRQQAQDGIHRGGNLADATGSPRPQLRAHVLDRDDAGAMQGAGQAEVECRGVDADEGVHPLLPELALQARAQPQQPRQVAQRLHEAHHGDFLGGAQRHAARRPHALAGEPDKGGVRNALAQRLDQGGAQQVS